MINKREFKAFILANKDKLAILTGASCINSLNFNGTISKNYYLFLNGQQYANITLNDNIVELHSYIDDIEDYTAIQQALVDELAFEQDAFIKQLLL